MLPWGPGQIDGKVNGPRALGCLGMKRKERNRQKGNQDPEGFACLDSSGCSRVDG